MTPSAAPTQPTPPTAPKKTGMATHGHNVGVERDLLEAVGLVLSAHHLLRHLHLLGRTLTGLAGSCRDWLRVGHHWLASAGRHIRPATSVGACTGTTFGG